MMEKSVITLYSRSDRFFLELVGRFIQQARLQQNKTQQQVADSAGISRSTVGQIEKGKGGTLLSLLQLLRVLEKLSVLQAFEEEYHISPIKLAKLQQKKRKRARNNENLPSVPDVNW